MSKSGLSRSLGQRSVSGQLNKVISALLADGSIGYTIPEKPRSRLQKYRLTDAGRAAAERLPDGGAKEKRKGSVAGT
jgi:ATP-dependent DNA helicase RecG